MEEEVINQKNEESYLKGIVGAIVGGIIATIPWILVYLYGNMILSVLAILIAAGEFYGYKLFKGKMTKLTPAIIMIIAVVIVSIATLIVIPSIQLSNEGINVNINTIKALYQDTAFTPGIIHDFVISVLFTIVGASAITANLNKQIKNSENGEIKLDLNNNEEVLKIKKESIEKVKPIFEKYNSLDKEHGILKDELFAEFGEEEDVKTAFNYLKSFGIIKTSKGKFYYSTKNEEKQTKTKDNKTLKIIATVVTIIAVVILVFMVGNNIFKSIKTNKISDNTVSFEINELWNSYSNANAQGWNYYRYINTVPPLESNTIKNSNVSYDKYPAYLNITHYEIDTDLLSSIEAIQSNMNEYTNSLEEKPDIYEENITKTKNGYDMLIIKMYFKEGPEQIEYLFYILNGNEMVCIDTYSFNMEDEKDIKDNAIKIIDTLKWKE